MSEANEGLTNVNETSSDLEQTESTESVENTETTQQPEKSETKRVSERINQVRQEEALKYQKQIDDLTNKVNDYEAREKGVTVEELIAERQKEEAERNEMVENDPRYQALLERDFERQKADTLNTIQKAYPEENLENIDNLPEDFYKMLQAGVDPAKAYRASVIMDRKEIPPSSGSVKTNDEPEKGGSYTREEVASMSQEEVHAHWDEITKSMKNW